MLRLEIFLCPVMFMTEAFSDATQMSHDISTQYTMKKSPGSLRCSKGFRRPWGPLELEWNVHVCLFLKAMKWKKLFLKLLITRGHLNLQSWMWTKGGRTEARVMSPVVCEINYRQTNTMIKTLQNLLKTTSLRLLPCLLPGVLVCPPFVQIQKHSYRWTSIHLKLSVSTALIGCICWQKQTLTISQ